MVWFFPGWLLCAALGQAAVHQTTKLDARRFDALIRAYPDSLKGIEGESLRWRDGTLMPLGQITADLDAPTLADQLAQVYPTGPVYRALLVPGFDPGRSRYTPFFTKMYGRTAAEVESKLVSVPWLPKVFGAQSTLRVTTVNQVDRKIAAISAALEALAAEFHDYLSNPGGTFTWRPIAGTQRLSAHSFGMTLDINVARSNYWRWDLERASKDKRSIDENTTVGAYRNRIPWAIVDIFEKHGFVWGGKWHHYDTMHFEYRPELFD